MKLYEFEFKRTFHLEGCEKVGKYQIVAETEQLAYFQLGQAYSDPKGEYDVEILSCKVVGEFK